MATPKKKVAKKKVAKKKVAKKKEDNTSSEITMHYIKTDSYRTFHVDGAFGGLTTRGNLYCEFFVERSATPQQITYKLNKGNEAMSLGEEKERLGKDGVVRQIECGISLDIAAAKSLNEWLIKKIDEHNNFFSKPKGKNKK